MRRFFHMHLISDATGETLNMVARAAMAHYADYQPVEHIYALVRTPKQLQRVLGEIERQPGVAGVELRRVAVPEVAQEVGLHGGAGEERGVHLRVVEPGHRPAVEPDGPRREQEVRPLQRRVP